MQITLSTFHIVNVTYYTFKIKFLNSVSKSKFKMCCASEKCIVTLCNFHSSIYSYVHTYCKTALCDTKRIYEYFININNYHV